MPPESVIQVAVCRIAQSYAEIKGRLLVERVDRLDHGVKDLGGIEHHRRVCRQAGLSKSPGHTEKEPLGRGFFVGDVGVAYGEVS